MVEINSDSSMCHTGDCPGGTLHLHFCSTLKVPAPDRCVILNTPHDPFIFTEGFSCIVHNPASIKTNKNMKHLKLSN